MNPVHSATSSPPVRLSLPKREGTRPKTHYAIPHHQIDQTPSAEIYDRLVERFLDTPNTTHGKSLISRSC